MIHLALPDLPGVLARNKLLPVSVTLAFPPLPHGRVPECVWIIFTVLSRQEAMLPPFIWRTHPSLDFWGISFPSHWLFWVGYYPVLDKRTRAGFCRQLVEISLLSEYIWLTCNGWVDFSTLKVTRPRTLQLTLLVFVMVKFLLVKGHLPVGFYLLYAVDWQQIIPALSEWNSERILWGPLVCICYSGGNSKRIKNSCQSIFGSVCIAARGLLGKSEGPHQFPCPGYEDYLSPRISLRRGTWQ